VRGETARLRVLESSCAGSRSSGQSRLRRSGWTRARIMSPSGSGVREPRSPQAHDRDDAGATPPKAFYSSFVAPTISNASNLSDGIRRLSFPLNDSRSLRRSDRTRSGLTDERGLVYRYPVRTMVSKGEEGNVPTFARCWLCTRDGPLRYQPERARVGCSSGLAAFVNNVGLLAEEVDGRQPASCWELPAGVQPHRSS